MNFDHFNKGIENIIDMLSYDFYIIKTNEKLRCKCVDKTTEQADPNCLQCLGLGYKIRIIRTEGYQNDEKISIRSGQSSESVASVVYYIKLKSEQNDEALIIDGTDTYVVSRVERLKSSNNNIIYKKVYCTPKKNTPSKFIENFYSVVNK